MLNLLLDAVYASSQTIRVIDPTDKESNKEVITAAQKVIRDAKCLYILGYGFDNSKRLELSEATHYERNSKWVLFTNYNNSNRINKSASGVFVGNSNNFLRSYVEGNLSTWYFEKSVRDTYEALELDFDPLEEHPI
jgi:hypothetical protein